MLAHRAGVMKLTPRSLGFSDASLPTRSKSLTEFRVLLNVLWYLENETDGVAGDRLHYVACASVGPCAMVKGTAPSSYLRSILYWSSFQTICSPLNDGRGLLYPGSCRQRKHDLGGLLSLLSRTRVIRDTKLYLVQFINCSMPTGEALLFGKLNADFPYLLQCRKTSSTVCFQQQAKGLHQEWVPNTFGPPLTDSESFVLKPTTVRCPAVTFWLRSVCTQAKNSAKDVSRPVCHAAIVPGSKVSLNIRGRYGCGDGQFQKRDKRRALSPDTCLKEENLSVTKRNFTTVSFTPEEGGRGLTSGHVLRTLQTKTDAKSAMAFFEWAGQQTGYEHSPATYCALVNVLGSSKESDALRQVRVDIERTKWRTSGVVRGTLARAYCQCELFEEALEYVRKMYDPGYPIRSFQFNNLLEVLVKAGHLDEAYLMYEEMLAVGCRPDPCTFNILMNGFGKAGRLEMMEKLFQEMKDKCCKPTVVTFGTLVNVLCKAGRQDDAYILFNSNKSMANVVVYNTMLDGLGKIGRIEQALKLFKEMKEKAFVPRVDTVNIVIQSLGLANRDEEAWSLFKEMTTMDLVPDLFTYNLMMKILISVNKVDESLRLLKEMTSSRCMPDTVTYGTLIYGLGECGDVNKARELFRQMRATGLKPNVIVYGALIGALCKGNKLDESIMVFNEMMAAGCTPDEFVYATVCGNLFKAGRVDEAQRMFNRMGNKDKQTCLVAYNSAIHGLGMSGEMQRLWNLFQQMLHTGCQPDVITYNTLIAHLGKYGNVDKASKLFLDMQVSGCSPDVVSYSTLIDMLCRQGRSVQALEMFEDMKEKGIAPNAITYGSLIWGLCRGGQFERAYSVYKKMISQGCLLDEIAYRTLIQGFSCSLEYVDECYALFNEMTEKGYSSDHLTSHLLMKSLKKAGKLGEAQCVMSKMPKRQRGKQLGAIGL